MGRKGFFDKKERGEPLLRTAGKEGELRRERAKVRAKKAEKKGASPWQKGNDEMRLLITKGWPFPPDKNDKGQNEQTR